MKKRILSLALVLMLCLSLLPMAALAASEEAATEPVEATTETTGEIVAEPTPEPTPEPVALEGASAETSETTNEPSVQSMDEPQVAQEGDTVGVKYLDLQKAEQTRSSYTVVANSNSGATWTAQQNDGWYVVDSDVTITGAVTLSGNVNLILCDGYTLTVSNGIVGEDYSLTIYGQSSGTGKLTVTTSDVSTTGYESYAKSYGIYTDAMTVNGGTVTAKAGNAESTSSDADSYGIYVATLSVNGGEVTATGGTVSASGNAKSYGIYLSASVGDLSATNSTVTGTAGSATSTGGYAESFGIYVLDGNLSATNSTVTGTAGSATSTGDYAYSVGIEADSLTVTGGTVEATAGNASGASYVESYGICAIGVLSDYAIKVSGGTITATAGSAESTNNKAYSYGIYAGGSLGNAFTVSGGTITATAGNAKDVYDLFIVAPMTISNSTVQSSREGGAVRVCVGTLNVSGGTMKLGEGTVFYDLVPTESVKLSDLLADGCAYWKAKHKEGESTNTDIGFVTLGNLTKLEHVCGETDSWYVYYVKPCTHSTDDGVCAYCGKSVGDASEAGSDAEPAPTATSAPTATPAPKAPNTADEANVTLWLALAMLSMMAVVVVARKKAR